MSFPFFLWCGGHPPLFTPSSPLPLWYSLSMLFIGLDGEMSCPSMEKGGKLIQVGLSAADKTGIETIAFYLRPPEDMYWDEKAAEVHGISQEKLHSLGKHPEEVDEVLYAWLLSKGADPKAKANTVPVGFNNSFDMGFLRVTLPKTFSLLSRRGAELNGMLWLLHGKTGKTFEDWKEMALEYAKMNMSSYRPHDAGWDSARHLLCFEYLKTVL